MKRARKECGFLVHSTPGEGWTEFCCMMCRDGCGHGKKCESRVWIDPYSEQPRSVRIFIKYSVRLGGTQAAGTRPPCPIPKGKRRGRSALTYVKADVRSRPACHSGDLIVSISYSFPSFRFFHCTLHPGLRANEFLVFRRLGCRPTFVMYPNGVVTIGHGGSAR